MFVAAWPAAHVLTASPAAQMLAIVSVPSLRSSFVSQNEAADLQHQCLALLRCLKQVPSTTHHHHLTVRQGRCILVYIVHWHAGIQVTMHKQHVCIRIDVAAEFCHVCAEPLLQVLHNTGQLSKCC